MDGMKLDRILRARVIVTAVALAGLAVSACSRDNIEYNYPDKKPGQAVDPVGSNKKSEGVFGTDGIRLWGPSDKPADPGAGGGIGVNSFLWRASLDTVSFMPLVSADPFGGVIITDWYSPPQSPEERFKVNVYILGRALRADGLRASVFRQQLDGTTGWIDAPVASNTATDLENAILTRARQMRVAQLGGAFSATRIFRLDFHGEGSVHAGVVGCLEGIAPPAVSASPQWRGFGWWEYRA